MSTNSNSEGEKIVKICVVKLFTVKRCRENPDTLYVFGDNLLKKGKKGQAIIRDEPNAIGIPTKKKPTMYADAFFTDDELQDNTEEINDAADMLKAAMKRPHIYKVAYPADGLGTGLAMLEHKAPKTMAVLKKTLPGYEAVSDPANPIFKTIKQ